MSVTVTRSSSANENLGAHLAEARKAKGLSVSELAARTGLSRAYLSKLEKGQNSPTVHTLNVVLQALGLSLAELFLGLEGPQRPFVGVADRRLIELPQTPGVSWEMVTPPGAKVEMFVRRVEPGAESGAEPHTHGGSEVGIVTEGELHLDLAGELFVLGPGDSINFASSTPHRYWNSGDETCVAVWASTEPRP